MKILDKHSGESAEGSPMTIKAWQADMQLLFEGKCDFVDVTDMTACQYLMLVDDMNRMNSWSSVKNKRGYIGTIIDNRAAELGYTRDNLTLEVSSGGSRSHSYSKNHKGITVKGNIDTGELTIKEYDC